MKLVCIALLGCSLHANPDFCNDHPGQCDASVTTDAAPRSDDDCPSQALRADGTCAVESDVLYASATGGGTDCSRPAPCSLATGLDQLGAKTLLHVAAGTYTSNTPIALPNPGRHYVVFGPGTFTQSLSAAANVDVALERLEVAGAAVGVTCANGRLTGVALYVHDNTGYGVQGAPCTLTLSRSTIAHNGDGGLVVNQGVIDVANNLFVQNGDAANTNAVAMKLTSVSGRMSFNTIAYNHTASTTAAVHCTTTQLAVTGNLITANDRAATFGTQADGGGCDFSTSYTLPGSAANDLGFNRIDGSLGSFRLTALSRTVIDVPGLSCSGTDIDGEIRPHGSSCDDGADEAYLQ